jgi:hypothetical protein
MINIGSMVTGDCVIVVKNDLAKLDLTIPVLPARERKWHPADELKSIGD